MNSRSCDYLWLSTFWSFLILGFLRQFTCSRWRRFTLTFFWPPLHYFNTAHTAHICKSYRIPCLREKKKKEVGKKSSTLQSPGPGSGFVLMSVAWGWGPVEVGCWAKNGVTMEECGVNRSPHSAHTSLLMSHTATWKLDDETQLFCCHLHHFSYCWWRIGNNVSCKRWW